MSAFHFDYDGLVQASLKGVIRDVLSYVAENGLPGDHHFYITFDTSFDGLSIPDYLRERYPDDMTIVLQKGFWGLVVGEDEIEVNLTFNQKPELLVIPFAAIIAFVDPSAEFALQFQSDLYPDTDDEDEDESDSEETEFEPADESVIVEPQAAKPAKAEKAATTEKPAKAKTRKSPKSKTKSQKSDESTESGNVITLDTFRRKG